VTELSTGVGSTEPAGSGGGGLAATGADAERVVLFDEGNPLVLDSGARLAPVEVVYETYGTLADDASNAVFVCHALTGDAHAAGESGWWDTLVGPGKPVDTDRFFVVCPNLLGGCRGTTGPSSVDPRTGRPYGLRFPQFTVGDLVRVHRALAASLGIERLAAAIGGSLGGMQVLQWALDHPGELDRAVVIAAPARLSAQNIAFSAVARASILQDEHFHGGDYYDREERPEVGLAVARMLAHITYVSEASLERKFGRRRDGDAFEVERYLHHQGRSFLRRFDANSYLYLTRVMESFDAFAGGRPGRPATRFLLLSFDTDWRFPTRAVREVADALTAAGGDVRFREIASPHGHDSFLLPVPAYHETVRAFLGDCAPS
jgi:homoserine O-acetyltransferase